MVEFVNWPGENAHQVLAHVRSLLLAGKLAIVPSEAGYECVANALDASAISALGAFVGPAEFKPMLLGNPLEIFDWLPLFRGVGPRLVRRFWPGPLIIFGAADAATSLTRRLPQSIVVALMRENALGLRLPEHDALRDLKRTIDVPLATACCPGDDSRVWINQLGDKLGIVITE